MRTSRTFWLSHPDPKRVRPTTSPQKTFWNDRFLAIGFVVTVAAVSAVSISLLLGPLRPIIANLHGATFRVRPVDGMLFGLVIGVPFAAFNTAWPAYFLSHIWFVLTRQLPWRFMPFLGALRNAEILRQEGRLYQLEPPPSDR